MKVTGLPARVPEVAISVFVPAVPPRIQLPIAAMPVPDVRTGSGPVVLPPPPVTANVTLVLATGLPYWSVTRTAGAVVTAVPTVAL